MMVLRLISGLVPRNCGPQVRHYPRWSHRNPVKVFSPEEYEQIEAGNKEPNKSKFKDKAPNLDKYSLDTVNFKRNESEVKFKVKPNARPLVATHQKSASDTKKTTDMLETVIDLDGNFVYTKMGNSDPRVGTILTAVKSKNEKAKKDLILLEGKRLIKDALLSGCKLKYIVFSRKTEVEYLKPYLPKLGATLYKMPYSEMQMWSDLTTNPGIMGIFKTPAVEEYKPSRNSLPVTVICDNIREPGNLGAILRVCAGVGCERVILTKGCVNLWDTKVLRSSAGAHFKLQIHRDFTWDKLSEKVPHGSHFYIADNKTITTVNEGEDIQPDQLEVIQDMPLIPYYGNNFKGASHIVLVVGGETMGVSLESYQNANEVNGVRLNIPLSNEVESLNVGAALGVIAFEIKRQISSK